MSALRRLPKVQLLRNLPIELPQTSISEPIQPSDLLSYIRSDLQGGYLKVEFQHRPRDIGTWQEIDVGAGRAIMELILKSESIAGPVDPSIPKSEEKPMIFRLRYISGTTMPPWLYAEIFKDFTWLCFENKIWLKLDTSGQFPKLKELASSIAKGANFNH